MEMQMAADIGANKDGVLFVIKEGQWLGGPNRDYEQWPVLEEVEMDGQKWERWAQLYYVEGQKYSIGQRFESRAAQGEYLFCYGPGVSKKATHCEIICEDGSFWIVDLQGGGTFLNGSRLGSVGNKTELKFGDIISLGGVTSFGAEKNEEKDNNSTAFLFKSAGAGCDQEDMLISKGRDTQNENPFPAHNSLIFSKILSHLSLSDIKNCRLVSSEWTEETTKVLLKTPLSRLNFSEGYNTPFARTRLFAYIQEMGQIVSQGRFHLKLPNCICDCRLCNSESFHSCGTEFPQAGTPPHKFWFDLEWFFDGGFPHPVTMLKLNGSLRCKQGVTLCETALERVKQTLEELDLILDFDVEPEETAKPFCIPFSVLKTLGITLQSTYIPREYNDNGWIDEDFDFEADYSNKMSDWITSMIQSAPNIHTLKLKTLTYMAMEFPNLVLKSIIAKEGFTNLNSLELRSYNQKTLKLLLKLPQTLQSLTLELDMHDIKSWRQNQRERLRMDGDSDYRDSDDDFEEDGAIFSLGYRPLRPVALHDLMRALDGAHDDGNDDSEDDEDDDGDDDLKWKTLLEKVLNKTACELKHLCLNVPYMKVRKPNTIKIQMPAFPNLKVFKLNGFRKNCITFSDFGLDYDKHFPLLEHLAVQSGITGKKFFDIFRPIDKDHECKTVRSLDLNVGNQKRKWSRANLSKLAKLFPNVINPQLENVRKLPHGLEA